MKLELKTPCRDCPFINGSSTNQSLEPERIEEIVSDIRNDMSFTCHKTLSLDHTKQQHCAGAMIFLEKENKPNQMMRWFERIGQYDHKKLNMSADIIDDI